MLILTRREEEAIQIGDNIRIVVVKMQGGQVRLGIEAPPDMQIVREELLGSPIQPDRLSQAEAHSRPA